MLFARFSSYGHPRVFDSGVLALEAERQLRTRFLWLEPNKAGNKRVFTDNRCVTRFTDPQGRIDFVEYSQYCVIS